MAARRLILAMLVLLVLSSGIAALVPIEREPLSETGAKSMTTHTTGPSGALRHVTVSADANGARVVRLRLGDQLVLGVSSQRAGQVEIAKLGLLEPVDRFARAHFDLLPTEPGTYPVRLLRLPPGGDPGRVVARIIVSEPQSRTKSPGSSSTGSISAAREQS